MISMGDYMNKPKYKLAMMRIVKCEVVWMWNCDHA